MNTDEERYAYDILFESRWLIVGKFIYILFYFLQTYFFLMRNVFYKNWNPLKYWRRTIIYRSQFCKMFNIYHFCFIEKEGKSKVKLWKIFHGIFPNKFSLFAVRKLICIQKLYSVRFIITK